MFSIIMQFIKRPIANDVNTAGAGENHVFSYQFYVSFVIVQVNVYDARPAVASLLNVNITSCI